MSNTNTEIKPDIRILKINESSHWTDDKLKAACGVIFGVYMYDASKHVHCCEITPSYEMHFIESQSVRLPDDEEERERIYESLQEGDLHTEPVSYMHCRDIDRIEEIPENRSTYELSHRFKLSHLEGEEWGDEDTSAIDEAMEWVRSNSV